LTGGDKGSEMGRYRCVVMIDAWLRRSFTTL